MESWIKNTDIREPFGPENDSIGRIIDHAGEINPVTGKKFKQIGSQQFLQLVDEGYEEFVFKQYILKLNYYVGRAYLIYPAHNENYGILICDISRLLDNYWNKHGHDAYIRLAGVAKSLSLQNKDATIETRDNFTFDEFKELSGWDTQTFKYEPAES